ncbi:MAG: MBL fold metallo-hydrolase [Clostridiales bacterium]|nr:MBL fold metallo-hydrolase [Clostridiales bacterium]
MLIKTFVVGQLQTNCYIVTDEKTLDCAVIDPGAQASVILDYLESNKLKARAIFITHGHFDHTTAAETVMKATGADMYIHRLECADKRNAQMKYVPPKGVKHYAEGDEIRVSGLVFKVLETPGHSPGSVTLMCEDALFTGDTLFRDSCGRTDFEGGSMSVMLKSLKRLYELEGDFEVYPGHADHTSLSRERSVNYYMLRAIEQ